ncbi:variant surface glycoprotein (VSG), putative [Trypanosoma equiperdum]|uniref:Variant surface glycoprotein (VSG), putative n=2 Tax=Trypanozoon TaxID=39700 RepID=Q380Y2_TRYB2|nr:variant surface glycoprotein [Trypanosoma brucei brucei TREU927]EAN80649.1 variant surface glycoprotein (VSG), putative [Trypanosoma brucei brucei TREU927]SCU68739.1 variant surface glycoprotein (VSG), putative [Trypanosoma equiperdum]
MRSLLQIFLTVAASLVAGAAIQKAEAAAGQGIHEEDFNPLCAVSDELKKSEGYAKHLISELDAAASVGINQALRLKIYAETLSTATQRTKLRTLANAYIDYCIAEFTDTVNNCQTALGYTAATNYVAAGVDAVMDLLIGAEAGAAGANGACTRTGDATSSTAKTKSQLNAACTERYKADRPHNPAKKPTAANVRLAPRSGTALTSTNHQTCALTSTQSDCLFHSGHVNTRTIDFLDGLVGLKKDGLKTKAFDPSTAQEATHLALFTEKTALQTLNAIEGKAGAAAGNKSTEQLATLSTLASRAAASQEKKDSEGAELKTQEFGDAGSKINQALWHVVEKLEVAKEALPEASDRKLGSINSFQELTRVTGYYEALKDQQLEKLQKQLTELQETTKKKSKTREQICNEKKDADTCKADKNCKYDETKKEEPQCVLSDKGKQAAKEAESHAEKVGKTTIITGNNCFVIHKAPLLFAFLLL